MNKRLYPLTNPYFLLLLFALLANDLYLKYEYHNWITGKLSDVVGLFVFAYFWTALFPRLKKEVYLLTGLAFIFWKCPHSQFFINYFTEIFYPIHRTIDMSDLLALLVLPIGYYVEPNGWSRLKMELVSPLIAALTIFSFCATSVPRPTQIFDRPEYVLFRSVDVENTDNFPNEFRVFDLDSMKVIAVTTIETESSSMIDDDYYKSKILADLDLRVVRASKHEHKTDLSSYQSLRDSLTIFGNTSITLNLDSVFDELNFLGTRLHGHYRRYSKKQEVLIDGRYKNGIPDSTWSFHRTTGIIRKHFRDGELTMIERINDGSRDSTRVDTRNDSISKAYWTLSIISVLLIVIVIKLFLNIRSSVEETIVKTTSFEKISQIVLLPTVIFIIAKVISGFISDSNANMFQVIGEFMLTNIILAPVFVIVFYGIRLRSRFDLIFYALLFVFALIWIYEYQFLKNLVSGV